MFLRQCAPSRWECRVPCRESDSGDVGDRNRAYAIWRGNVNRVKGDRNWLVFVDRRRIAKSLLDARPSAFVSINLDPDLPPKKLYSNLRQLDVIKESNKVEVAVDVVRMNQFFVTRSLPQNELDFDIPVRLGVPEFSFVTVDSKDVFDAFMAVIPDASGFDGISLSFVKMPALTHLFNFIFTCSEFLSEWKCAVVLPIPKVSNPTGCSDFHPISLLPCLSKVCEVLMAGQMNRHIRYFGLLCPFQSGYRRHHSTITAVLKVTEDIRLNLEDGRLFWSCWILLRLLT
jgi:hypothetical protein